MLKSQTLNLGFSQIQTETKKHFLDNLWIWLVVEPYPSEKDEFVNWDDDIPNIWDFPSLAHPDFSLSPSSSVSGSGSNSGLRAASVVSLVSVASLGGSGSASG